MQKTFSGYCPTQDKEFSVTVEYIDSSTLQKKSYTKGLATCKYASYGGECNCECPIIDSAPNNL